MVARQAWESHQRHRNRLRGNSLCRRRYFSISTGETESASPMLSKPKPESSTGNGLPVNSPASKSRTVFCCFSPGLGDGR